MSARSATGTPRGDHRAGFHHAPSAAPSRGSRGDAAALSLPPPPLRSRHWLRLGSRGCGGRAEPLLSPRAIGCAVSAASGDWPKPWAVGGGRRRGAVIVPPCGPAAPATGGDSRPRRHAGEQRRGTGTWGGLGAGWRLGTPRAASRTLDFSLTGTAARGDRWGGAGPARSLEVTARRSVRLHCGICAVLAGGMWDAGCGMRDARSHPDGSSSASVRASAKGPADVEARSSGSGLFLADIRGFTNG